VLATLGLCLVVAVAFASVFVAIGLATANVQVAQGVSMLVMPLSFLSSAYVPTATMPGALRAFAEHQPVTMLANAARYLAQGSAGVAGLPASGPHYVVAGLAWCAGILAVAVPLTAMLFRRR
jgi:ABC-type multidrug transport system permease subunit